MTRTLVRLLVIGLAAGATMGAAAAFVPVTATAEAAPSRSPFAGKYVGAVPDMPTQLGLDWTIAISRSGAVKASYSYVLHYKDEYNGAFDVIVETWSGEFGGAVDSGGGLSIAGTQTFEMKSSHYVSSYSTSYAAPLSLSLDPNGDLVVTNQATGASGVWSRQ